jgi:hypothetical protein
MRRVTLLDQSFATISAALRERQVREIRNVPTASASRKLTRVPDILQRLAS